MNSAVVYFLPYMINLSAFDRSAPCVQGVHLQGHLASLLSCPASISLCLMSQDLVPISWWLAPEPCIRSCPFLLSASSCLARKGCALHTLSYPNAMPSLLPSILARLLWASWRADTCSFHFALGALPKETLV